MAQVRWEQSATEDVRQIYIHIAPDSRTAAANMVRRIRAEGKRLARFPECDRMVPEHDNPRYR